MEKPLLYLCLFFNALALNAQDMDIIGKVVAEGDDVEGIHIINKTANKFTITDTSGAFTIPAKLNDTILVSGIKYKHKEVIVNDLIMQSKHMTVYLEEHIYQLDEVLVGKFLTGDLRSDILNTKIKHDVNFYDVGIPGYTGRPLTQKERRLFEADHGKMLTVFQNGLININIHKILNRISGRTKKLKNIVRLEALDVCMNRAKSEFSEAIFGNLAIEDHLKTDFFYYASEDAKFMELCQQDNGMAMFEFLVEKLMNYKENQVEGKD
ncbi:MAG TPA: carboxypeptidase-like regulatory domain-containing protein [Flavobacteriaceae bacterium]